MVTLDQAGWQRNALVVLPPPAHLAHVVELLWLDTRAHASSGSRAWRIVADDAPHLIYARCTDPRCGRDGHRLSVVGARRTYEDIDCSRRLFTAGARLLPGAIPALFRIRARELTDRTVPVELFARDLARHTLARLGDEPPGRATDLVTSFAADLVRRGRPLDARAQWLAGTKRRDPTTIREAARVLGITERALHAWAMTHLGLGVKRFLSVRRLHRALEARLSDGAATWSRIADISFAIVAHSSVNRPERFCRGQAERFRFVQGSASCG
jgi:hypothetical protein